MIRTNTLRGLMLIMVATLFAVPGLSAAADLYGVDGDEFEIWFYGANDFRLRTDPADSFLSDPTLILTEGHTYTFTHSGTMHPFAFLDDSAPIAAGPGGDGNEYVRTVNDQSFLSNVLDGGSMVVWPVGSSQGSSTLDWTPVAGNYYYTCGVQWHTNMAGFIVVEAAASGVPEPTAFGLSAIAVIGLGCLRRRRR